MKYAIASGLIGFQASELRVRVTEIRGDYAWVITADILDAGTRLILNPGQLREIEDPAPSLRHCNGLVAIY